MQTEARILAWVPLPPREVYAAWERLEAYPTWVRDLRRVSRLDRGIHQWRLHGPTGPLHWEAEITVREPARRFAYCLSGDGVEGCRKVGMWATEGRTKMVVEDRLLARGRAGPRIMAWWGDPQVRLQGDISHLLTRLRSQTARRPEPVGFRWATASEI